MVTEFDYQGPLGIGFPAVVMDGVVVTPPTSLAYPGWVDLDLARRVAEETGCPTAVLNDADAAGYAEMRFGNGRNEQGVVMVFTLGTGIGSALFLNGRLVPNTELGRSICVKRSRAPNTRPPSACVTSKTSPGKHGGSGSTTTSATLNCSSGPG
jgi:hypothetical protein